MGNLVYTITFDAPGFGGTRQLAKMLAASLARTFWDGDVVVIRNSPHPLFMVERVGLKEIYVDITGQWEPDATGPTGASETEQHQAAPKWTREQANALAQYAMQWKFKARELIDHTAYDWIVFLDVDCLVLRNLDHLFAREDVDILFQTEPGRKMTEPVFNAFLPVDSCGNRDGINSGTWAIRSEHYPAIMDEWARIYLSPTTARSSWREQAAWNRLLVDCRGGRLPWRTGPFEAGEIQFPLHLHKDWRRYKDAALLHAVGGTPHEKIQFLFGMFMQRFFADTETTLVNILEM